MKKYRLLLNGNFYISCLFLIMQQLIVAFSTYAIANLGKELIEKSISNFYISLFIISLVIVYIPAYFAMLYLEKAKYQSWQTYYEYFSQNFLGKSTYFSDTKIKNEAIANLSQESKATIDTAMTIAFDVFASFFNIIFNILVIAFLLNSSIIAGYFIGILLSAIFIKKINNRIGITAHNAQQSRIMLVSSLLNAWDNIILNNTHNYQLYEKILQKDFKKTVDNEIKAESTRNISSSIGMILLLVPVVVCTIIIFYYNLNNYEVLAVLVATLPRQIQLLQICYALIGYAVDIKSLHTRIEGIFAIFDGNKKELNSYIQHDKITVYQTGEVFDKNKFPDIGRITLIGENGVGKTSLLLQLKQEYQELAFYLPAKHNLIFNYHQESHHQGSTGQELIKQITELSQNLEIKLLLLDEWDAHLDSNNVKIIDELLYNISKHCLIIDIRHRLN